RGARRVRCVLRNRLCDGGARAGCPHFGRAGIDSRLPGPIDRTQLAEADRSGTVRSGVTATPRSITTRPPCSVCILLSSGERGRNKNFQTRRRGGLLPLMSTLFSGKGGDRGSRYPALRSRLNESRLTVRGFVTPDPTISIVTPAYNASEFVAGTLTAALGQNGRDCELLIVDGGSNEDTLSSARAWARTDPRMRVLTRAHGGPSAARNAAIAHARGTFLALLDSDDVWLPSFLEAQMKVFDDCRPCDVVTGNAYN